MHSRNTWHWKLFTPTRLALARSDALIAICRRQHAKLLVSRIRAATSTLPLSVPHPADLAQQLSWASGSRISSATCKHSFRSGAAWIDSQFRARREQGTRLERDGNREATVDQSNARDGRGGAGGAAGRDQGRSRARGRGARSEGREEAGSEHQAAGQVSKTRGLQLESADGSGGAAAEATGVSAPQLTSLIKGSASTSAFSCS